MKKQKFLSKRKLVKTTTIAMALLIAATLISSSAVSVTIGSNTQQNKLNSISTKPYQVLDVDPNKKVSFADARQSNVRQSNMQSSAIWDLQFSFDVAAASGAAGNTGVEWDGTYFYSCRWASNLMHQYDDTGSMLKEFSIPGVSGSRDFAYNDNNGYMYSGAAATTMWEYDVISETLISTYTMPDAVRALAYDSDEDAFWFNNWGNDITCADTSGTVLYTIPNTISLYSLAFDNLCGDPVLWLFSGTSTGGGCQIEQYTDIYAGGTLGPQSHTVGGASTWIAGGAGYTDSFFSGETTLMVLGQGDGDVDTIFCYEICETGPVTGTDLAVTAIGSPSSGPAGVITPEVTVKNFGNTSEVTDVQLEIGYFAAPITVWSYGFEDWTVEGFVHPGWTNERVVGTDPDCYWQGHDQYHYIYPDADPYEGSVCALVDTGYITNYGQTRAYLNTTFDFSSYGGDTLSLAGMFHKRSYGGTSQAGEIQVQVSLDASTWTTVGTIDMYDAANLGWQADSVDLSAYMDETAIYLGFLGVDGGYSDILMDAIELQTISFISEYDQTVTGVAVGVGATVDVTFPDWTPSAWQVLENVDITYQCYATQLLPDDDPSNDQKHKSATLNFPFLHDIALLSIDSPVTSGPGQTMEVKATIKNVGQFTECCYKTNMKIGSKLYTEHWQTIVWGGTRDWQIYDYGDHSYEPSDCGTGDYYAGCYYTGGGTWDTSLVTTPLDLTSAGSSATIEVCEEFQDYAGYGQFGIYVHSGGVPDASGTASSYYEETLYYETNDEIPRYGIYRIWGINPSLYADPSEVYIEFWYTDDGYANAWGCGIDGLAIPEIGFYEDFEGATFPPAQYIVIPEYDEDICTILLDPGEEAQLTFPDWTPVALGLGISGSIDYGIEAEQQLPEDTNPANDQAQAELTLDYWHDVKIDEITQPATDKAIWDLQFSFDVAAASGAPGNTGVEWDGTYFYSCRWASNLMHQYDDTGSMLKEFSIPGVSGSRDFAYNDNNGYMYSGAAATTMWEYDVISETLISTYTMPDAVRALAYDSDEDAFWFNNWGNDIKCADTSGTLLYTIPNTISLYSLAFDNLCGDPVLWLFSGTSTGGGCQIEQYIDIYAGGTLGPESHTVGGASTWIAGGSGYTDSFVDGYSTLMVLGQGDGNADTIFCYEICETGPPGAPKPDIFIQPGTESIEAIVENAGTFTESGMNVNAQIYEYITNVSSGNLVYDEDYTTGTIAPLGGQETATYPDYTFDDIAGVYLLVVNVALGTDDMPNNNEMDLGIGVDNVAPTSQHTLTPATPDGENDWYVSDVTVDFTADDGTENWQSGVDHIEYRVNGGSWQTGNSVTVTTDGEHTVQYKAIDKVGNEETANSVDFKIDQTVPTVDLTWESPDNVHVDFTATCSDATSDMWYVEFYINLGLMFTDNEAPFEWSIVWSPSLKNEQFIAKAFDMAGNWDTDMETGIEAFPYPHATPNPSARQTNPLQ